MKPPRRKRSARPCLWFLAAWAAACGPKPQTSPGATAPEGVAGEPGERPSGEESANGRAASSPSSAGATPTSIDPLDAITIPARPVWMNRFHREDQGDIRFFNISALMTTHDLTRAQAVELQNHYRDLSRSPSGTPAQWFATALARAKAGEFEDHRQLDRIATAKFIVVFDLDDTLYNQFYDSNVAAACHDYVVHDGDDTPRPIKLAPGAAAALDRVAALGGAVVIFTAAPDDRSWANLRAWEFGGVPLPEHPSIAGVLTHSHLVLQETFEGPGAANPRKGQPVIEPSKDLRILDENLDRVLMVDDNPLRLFQLANTRVIKKFDADRYCTTADQRVRKAFENTLPRVLNEIEDSLRWMDANHTHFARAHLPYTAMGALAVDFLTQAKMSRRAAIEHLRRHPELADKRF